jgi:hypothetical protein
MIQKGNVVLYLDKELVEKSKNMGFNLSKTFENHLKHLMMQFSTGNSANNFKLSENKLNVVGLPELTALELNTYCSPHFFSESSSRVCFLYLILV